MESIIKTDEIYIVYDGTFYVGIYGSEIEGEDEIAAGPFSDKTDEFERVIDELNSEIINIKSSNL